MLMDNVFQYSHQNPVFPSFCTSNFKQARGKYASWNSAFIFEEITVTIRQFNPGQEHFKKQPMTKKSLFSINFSSNYLKKGICSTVLVQLFQVS